MLPEPVAAPAHQPAVRLLQLVPEALPTFRADVSTLFGKYLPRHGISCHIVGKAGEGDAAAQGFASVRRPPRHARRWRNELAFAWLCLRTVMSVPRRDCDLVQVRDMVSIGLAAWCIARLRGLRFAYWQSFPICEGRIARARSELARRPSLHYRLVLWKGIVEQALLYKLLMRRADHVFVQSPAMLEGTAAQGVPRARMTAVPMGVDTEQFGGGQVAPRRLAGWERAPVLAYLGTLDASRCPERLVDILAIVRRRVPDTRLLLVGASPTPADLVRLRSHAAQLGLADAVHITGWLPTADALALLAGADAAISYFPRCELFDTTSPTKLLEYLALGMPCVGNDSPDQVYVLASSGAGWLTESSPEAMAEGVAAILADRDGARKRAGAGPAFIEQYRSYRVLSARLAERYRQLAQGAHACFK